MTISPGWYKDPAEPSTQRYWDGGGWLGAPLPLDAVAPDGPPPAEPTAPLGGPTVPLGAAADATVRAGQGLTPPPGGHPGQQPGQHLGQPTGRPGWPGHPGQPGQASHPGRPVQPPVGPWPGPLPPVRPHTMTLATPGARLVARLIDISLVLLLNIVVNGYFVYLWLRDSIPYIQDVIRAQQQTGEFFPKVAEPANYATLPLVIVLIAMGLWFAYEVPSTAETGQTVGKRLAKIKVVRGEADKPLGFYRSWRRWSLMGLPLLLWTCCGPFLFVVQFVDALFILTDAVHRKAWHDRSAGTYVVQVPEPTPATTSRDAAKNGADKGKQS